MHLRIVQVSLRLPCIVGRLIVEIVHLLGAHDSLNPLKSILRIAIEFFSIETTLIDELCFFSQRLGFSN